MEKHLQHSVKEPLNSWYVWYTKPRAEKKVRDRLLARDIEVFLPLQREQVQWSDRKKWVEKPLFNGYIFTHNNSGNEWETIKYTEGILNYVRFEGKPAIMRPEQMEMLKALLGISVPFDILETIELNAGETVEVIAGPFTGFQGQFVNYKGNYKLAVEIEQLGKSLLVHLPVNYVKSLKRA